MIHIVTNKNTFDYIDNPNNFEKYVQNKIPYIKIMRKPFDYIKNDDIENGIYGLYDHTTETIYLINKSLKIDAGWLYNSYMSTIDIIDSWTLTHNYSNTLNVSTHDFNLEPKKIKNKTVSNLMDSVITELIAKKIKRV